MKYKFNMRRFLTVETPGFQLRVETKFQPPGFQLSPPGQAYSCSLKHSLK